MHANIDVISNIIIERRTVSTKFNQKLVASISSNIYQKIFNSRYSEYTNVDNAYYIDQILLEKLMVFRIFSL